MRATWLSDSMSSSVAFARRWPPNSNETGFGLRLGGRGVERLERSGIELTWDPDVRVAVFRFLQQGTNATGKDARVFLEAIGEWTRPPDASWAMLVDCSQLSNVDAGWRSAFSAHFKHERHRASVAWFNANALVRTMVLMFVTAMRFGGPFKGKAFATEEEARSWLREMGIKA